MKRKGYAYEEGLTCEIVLYVPKNIFSGNIEENAEVSGDLKEKLLDFIYREDLVRKTIHPRPDYIEKEELLYMIAEPEEETLESSKYVKVKAGFLVNVSYTVTTSKEECYVSQQDLVKREAFIWQKKYAEQIN